MVKKNIKVPVRYLPSSKKHKDTTRQVNMLMKSRRLYKKGKYYTRKPIKSFKSKSTRFAGD